MAIKSRNAQKTIFPQDLYKTSGAATFGISNDAFEGLLREVARKHLPAGASMPSIVEFCRKLHLRDLVLAQACASGHEIAWNLFIDRYRNKLLSAAGRILKD